MAKKTAKENETFHLSKQEPFAIVKQENKYLIVVGNNLVTPKKFDTIKQAEEYIGRKPYDLIFNTCLVITKLAQENEKFKETTTAKESNAVEETN